MFGVITWARARLPGVASPLPSTLSDPSGAAAADARSVPRTCTTSPEEFAAFFRRWYGPALTAFEVLGPSGALLAANLADLARRWNLTTAAASPSPCDSPWNHPHPPLMHVLGPRRNTANQRLGRATVNQHVSSPTNRREARSTNLATTAARPRPPSLT